jgi:thiamine biosynthesis protein ThiI
VTILVAYGELSLKGRYVRSRLERALVDQIAYVLHRDGFKGFNILRRFGRIYVESVPGDAAEVISRVFGVVRAMPSERGESSLNSMISLLVKVAEKSLKDGMSFAVRPRVVGDHPYSSSDLAVEGGSAILSKIGHRSIRVDLEEPDVTFNIEVRDKDGFIYTRGVRGVGGLPYGTQGRMVSLFSGGIDSPVATWLMMKRGAETLPLLMDQRPYVGDSYIERAERAFKSISEYAPVDDFSLYSAPMGRVMKRIMDSSIPRLRCILCKRSMYRIAELFSEIKQGKGIITGESLGQVASQTLDNMFVLDSAVKIPVIRPTIGLDKVEIEHIAQQIGSYSVTAKNVEGCTVLPENPATTSKIKEVEELEEELYLVDLLHETAEEIEILC